MRFVGGIATAAALAAAVLAQAREAPDAFVAELYAARAAAEAAQDYEATDRLARAHLTPEMAALWDRALKADEPVVDGDIFYDAQDWEISGLTVTLESAAEAAAVVRVDFKVFEQPRTARFDLVAESAAWKIANIRYASGYDLRGMLTAPR